MLCESHRIICFQVVTISTIGAEGWSFNSRNFKIRPKCCQGSTIAAYFCGVVDLPERQMGQCSKGLEMMQHEI